MKKLSTGQDSTLENWIKNCERFFGKDSVQAQHFRNKAESAPKGLREEVVTDENQLLMMLVSMTEKEK